MRLIPGLEHANTEFFDLVSLVTQTGRPAGSSSGGQPETGRAPSIRNPGLLSA